MIRYNIDTPENTIVGKAETVDEIKRIFYKDIYKGDKIIPCLGHIETDIVEDSILWLSSVKELGVFVGINIGIRESSGCYLSLFNRSMLNEVVDVWDELYISKGLFLPPELAWSGIEDFISKGIISDKIQWITPNDIPEDGNYIL